MRCHRGFVLFTACCIIFFGLAALGPFALYVDAVDSLSVSSPAGSGASGSSGGAASSGGSSAPVGDAPGVDGVDGSVSEPLAVSELEIVADSVMLAADAQADEFPSGAGMQSGVYMTLDTSQFGQITVWVPSGSQYRSFALNDAGQPVNITSGAITGYYYGSTDYTVRWSTFGVASYRPYSGSSQWYDLGVRSVIASNVDMSQGQYILMPSNEMLLYFILFLMGAAILWISSR